MDKRRQPRFVVEGLHGHLTFTAEVEIVNMSLSGVALKLERRLEIGAEYTLKLEMDDRTVPVRGVVVWEALDGTRSRFGEDVPVYTAGMRFTDVITPRVAQLLEFIDRTKLIPDKRLGGVRFALEATGKALLDTPQPYRVKVISLRGMMVESDRPLEVESRCPMEVSQGGGAPLHFTGRVAFCGPATDGGRDVYHLGIEFLEMAPADRERLDALVKSLGSR